MTILIYFKLKYVLTGSVIKHGKSYLLLVFGGLVANDCRLVMNH